MRWEPALLNRSEFDLALRDFHEWPSHRQAFASGDVRLRRLPAGLVCGQGVLEQAFDRCRSAGGAEHVDEGAQGDRHLPVTGIIKKEPLEGGRPVPQHANQLPGA